MRHVEGEGVGGGRGGEGRQGSAKPGSVRAFDGAPFLFPGMSAVVTTMSMSLHCCVSCAVRPRKRALRNRKPCAARLWARGTLPCARAREFGPRSADHLTSRLVPLGRHFLRVPTGACETHTRAS